MFNLKEKIMGRKKKEVEEVVVEEVVEVQNESNTTQHLDRDPNDPRNVPPAETGFSLDNE